MKSVNAYSQQQKIFVLPLVIYNQSDISGPALCDALQRPQFESETSERLGQPGVAVGLAWTTMGGEIMFVEATRMEGEGKLILTGQLGDVMKESANLALNWMRSNAQRVCVLYQT